VVLECLSYSFGQKQSYFPAKRATHAAKKESVWSIETKAADIVASSFSGIY
jgi:hypothetical protein